jgi:hypothetical protein
MEKVRENAYSYSAADMIAQDRRSGLPGARSELAIMQRLAKRLGDVAGWPWPRGGSWPFMVKTEKDS